MPSTRKIEPTYQPPKIGYFIARNEPLGAEHGAYVAVLVPGGSWGRNEERICHCLTLAGADDLAALCNDARGLAVQWRSLASRAPGPNGADKGEEWAKQLIAHSIIKALGINAMHDFGASAMGRPMFGETGEG